MKFIGNSLLQFMGDFTVIDLETTGRSNKHYDITEISAIKYRKGKPVDSLSTLIKPDNTIIPFVVNLTGITDDMIKDSPKIGDKIVEFVNFIGDDVILGHNVEFDYALIYSAYYEKTGIKMNNDYIDTLRISRLLNKDIENHKLETLCKYFEVRRERAHRGFDDSKQTAEVYLKMYKKYYYLKNNKQNEGAFYERI